MNVPQAADRRLHPLSIAFTVVRRLREYVVPLALAVFASRSTRVLLFGAAGLAVIATISAVWDWLTYRYGYGDDELVVRSGKLFRNERHIPYSRIQNIDAAQNVLHRMFNVTVVQVQTGSGSEPEATMNLLPLPALAEMRERVFATRGVVSAESDAASRVSSESSAPDSATDVDSTRVEPVVVRRAPVTLLHLSSRDLLLAGLIENRGMALIAGAIAALSRFDTVEEVVIDRIEKWIPQWATIAPDADMATRISSMLLGGIVGLLVLVLFVRALSALWAMVRLHDFTLVRDGDDLRAEYGLFTRVTATIPLRRVQTISLHQRLLHRRLRRAAIRVTTAGAGGESGSGASGAEREWLAPIIPLEHVMPLLQQLDATLSFEALEWRAAHPNAVWRLFRISTIWGALLTGVAAYFIGWWAVAVAIVLLTWAIARARGIVRNLGAAIRDGRAFFRSGWLEHVTTVVRFERIQSVNFRQTLFDRRTGMATISADSAGLGADGLQMPYLALDAAHELRGTLSQAAVRTPFTW